MINTSERISVYADDIYLYLHMYMNKATKLCLCVPISQVTTTRVGECVCG